MTPTPERALSAVDLLRQALHLRMNGERAPGGNETWRDWDLKAEAYLRGFDEGSQLQADADLAHQAYDPVVAVPPARNPQGMRYPRP